MRYSNVLREFLVGYLILHIVAAVLFVWILTTVLRHQMIGAAKEKMNAMAIMLREHIDTQGERVQNEQLINHVRQLGNETGYRFTVIDATGAVVCDSRTGTDDIGPHGNRPEIIAAAHKGQGFSDRESDTLKIPMLYFAIPANRDFEPDPSKDVSDQLQTDGFVRVAASAVSIEKAIYAAQKYAWVFAIGMSTLTGFIMVLLSARMMKPLDQFSSAARTIGDGKYSESLQLVSGNDEWGQLSDAFYQMQSELARREQKLTASNQRMEAVLTSMIEGVLSISPNGDVRMANSAACEMLSLGYRSLVGKSLEDMFRQPELSQAITKAKSSRVFSETEFETLTEPRRLLSARVSPMGDSDSPPLAIILHDITELRQLETMRSDFVANVSHELKTPLASIKAYAETLLLGAINDPDKNIEFIKRIEESADLLNQQVQDLLQLARIESRQTTLEIENIDANRFCESSVERLLPLARKSEVEITFEPSDSPVTVRADEQSLETILNNLIANAINYTPFYGSVTVAVSQRENWGIIEVRDTGIGISSENQSRVFERFFRVDKARSRELGGTGLGLAIVKHLTLALGGSVHLNSSIGKGSSFEVHLPTERY